MKNDIKFKINNIECLKIILPCSSEEVFRYDNILIEYDGKDKKYILFDDFSIYGLDRLICRLNLVLSNKLKLHKSLINKEIGYLWTRYLYDDENIRDELVLNKCSEGKKYWVGESYLLWCSNKGKSTTWLYEKDSRIILGATPSYRWNPKISDKKNEKMYSEFLKNYKPLVITEISRKTAREWLKQAEELIEIIKANDSKYFIK